MPLAGDRDQEIQLVMLGPEVRTSTGFGRSESLGDIFWVTITTLAINSDSLREAVDSSEFYRVFFEERPGVTFKDTEINWHSDILGTRRLRPQGSLRYVNYPRSATCFVDCRDITQDAEGVPHS